jgi:anaerobic selenocysteine-containing dehydrogenase
LLKHLYMEFTPDWAEKETGVKADNIIALAQEIAKSGTAFATHVWRSASAAHLGGWMVARALFLLNVLTGSVGTHGGTMPNHSTKFIPKPHTLPTAPAMWNENHYPLAYPLAHFEMSFLLPYILKEKNKHLDVYFTRVYNPVWTNPDGFSWIEMLSNEETIGLHVAMTPVWSETAQYADYILPMGLGPERHDLHSYETHNSQWIALRQPVIRVAKELAGETSESTLGSNPGEVWEENEFWIELSWKIDPDGKLGIRKHYESPYRSGEKITINEYYRWIFENSVPGLKDAADSEGFTPLEYMRRYGAFEITQDVYKQHDKTLENLSTETQENNGFAWSKSTPPKINLRPTPGPFVDEKGRTRVGININGELVQGFPTPSGKLEFFSETLKNWGWPEYALPFYPLNTEQRSEMPHIVSQVHPSKLDKTNHEYDLLPTFRLPNLIHSRTNGAKWLYEISQTNPVWINPIDASQIGVETSDLVKVETDIGYFVDKVWVTEGLRPGVVACSHHLGRWRLNEDHGSDRWNSSLVTIHKEKNSWYMKQVHGVVPFNGDKDSKRIWWNDGGVNQNLTFPVQADPISGQHCWHQKVRVTKATSNLSYGDIFVDSDKAQKDYDKWLDLTRPAPGPGGMRRPYWLLRPLKPAKEFFKID